MTTTKGKAQRKGRGTAQRKRDAEGLLPQERAFVEGAGEQHAGRSQV